MPNYLLSFLFLWFVNHGFTQKETLPVELVYKDCRILSEAETLDTISGVPIKIKTVTIDAGQRVQTFCNYGKPENNTYDSVHVTATISYLRDSLGQLKTAIRNDFLQKIDKEEKYAASKNYSASVVPERYFYQIDSLFVPGIRKINSGEGNYVIWYIDGYVYKITLIEDNKLGSLNILLRTNVRLRRNNKFLNADARIMDIAEIKELLNEW